MFCSVRIRQIQRDLRRFDSSDLRSAVKDFKFPGLGYTMSEFLSIGA